MLATDWLYGMSLSDLAALVRETIANSTAVSAEREITRPTTAAFKATQNGNQEAKAAVELVPGVTADVANCCDLVIIGCARKCIYYQWVILDSAAVCVDVQCIQTFPLCSRNCSLVTYGMSIVL